MTFDLKSWYNPDEESVSGPSDQFWSKSDKASWKSSILKKRLEERKKEEETRG